MPVLLFKSIIILETTTKEAETDQHTVTIKYDMNCTLKNPSELKDPMRYFETNFTGNQFFELKLLSSIVEEE